MITYVPSASFNIACASASFLLLPSEALHNSDAYLDSCAIVTYVSKPTAKGFVHVCQGSSPATQSSTTSS